MPSGARSRIWTRSKGIGMAELNVHECWVYDYGCRADMVSKSEVDKVIADLEESHKKEVEQLQMKIAGLEKLVETANKLLKPAYEDKGGFTVKDVAFKGIRLEGMASEPEV